MISAFFVDQTITRVIIFLGITLLLSLILFLVSHFLSSSTQFAHFEKLSTYECGFDPFSKNQGAFDVKYYIIALLFLIFDLELIYLLPWSLAYLHVSAISLWVMLYFIFILTVAFLYEWLMGALEWK